MMEPRLTFKYDRTADILYIGTVLPYVDQEGNESGDDISACLDPDTGEVENLEVLLFLRALVAQ